MASLTAQTPTNCYPWWYFKILPLAQGRKYVVKSGCSINSDGNINCTPESMRAKAEATLRQEGWWATSKPLSLEAYTLARYMASEVGSGTPTERVAVGEAAVNRAKLEKLSKGVLSLLLYRQKAGHKNYGYYGPIHGPKDPATGSLPAPYGRWAATSQDPSLADLLLADLILSGQTNNFSNGADDQDGLEYVQNFPDPAAKVKKEAASGKYWVGPLPGVDHWHTFLWRKYGVSPTSPAGKALLDRGLAAVANRARPTWGELPECSRSDLSVLQRPVVAISLIGGLTIGLGFVLGRSGVIDLL